MRNLTIIGIVLIVANLILNEYRVQLEKSADEDRYWFGPSVPLNKIVEIDEFDNIAAACNLDLGKRYFIDDRTYKAGASSHAFPITYTTMLLNAKLGRVDMEKDNTQIVDLLNERQIIGGITQCDHPLTRVYETRYKSDNLCCFR